MIGAVYCEQCGRDITRVMKLYVGTTRLCYDCYEDYAEIKRSEKVVKKQKPPVHPLAGKVKRLYYKGIKPSQIADEIGLSTKQVYELISG